MEFEKTFTFDEKYVKYLTALTVDAMKKGTRRIVLIVADLAILLSGILNAVNGNWGSMIVAAALFLLEILFMKLFLPRAVRKGNAGQVGREMTLRFSDPHISFDFPGGTSTIRWSMLEDLVEREDFVALGLTGGRQFLVMERALLEEEELAWIRERFGKRNEVPETPVSADKYDI